VKAGEAMTQIGKYRIERELGRGAMGVVYQAFDPVVERHVAIKTIRVDDSGSLERLELLKREARSVGRFEHPNIITLYDAGEADGLFYMVMQLVQGETLKDRIGRQRRHKLPQIVDMFRQILNGLGYAHRHGVIHRDIKPANIMITSEGAVKLADFGISKLIGPGGTSSGLIVGTPSYMSPEQVLGRAVDARSDLFSVGCTLYEVLTGEKAYPGDTATAIMYKIVHGAPAPPASLLPGIDPRLEKVVLKALANDPDERFAGCAEMAGALEECLAARAGGTLAAAASLSVATEQPVAAAPAGRPAGRAPVRRRPPLPSLRAAAVAMTATFAVLALATIFIRGRSGAPDISAAVQTAQVQPPPAPGTAAPAAHPGPEIPVAQQPDGSPSGESRAPATTPAPGSLAPAANPLPPAPGGRSRIALRWAGRARRPRRPRSGRPRLSRTLCRRYPSRSNGMALRPANRARRPRRPNPGVLRLRQSLCRKRPAERSRMGFQWAGRAHPSHRLPRRNPPLERPPARSPVPLRRTPAALAACTIPSCKATSLSSRTPTKRPCPRICRHMHPTTGIPRYEGKSPWS
jgi:hypothetical protein